MGDDDLVVSGIGHCCDAVVNRAVEAQTRPPDDCVAEFTCPLSNVVVVACDVDIDVTERPDDPCGGPSGQLCTLLFVNRP